jgi:hypothetical protein
MAQDSARRTIRVGYEQFVPPPVPPGMYFDRDVWLVLPEGVRRAGKGRVAASWFLGVGLFIATVGIGYLVWGMVVRGRGHTPRSGCWACAAGSPGPAGWPTGGTWRSAR